MPLLWRVLMVLHLLELSSGQFQVSSFSPQRRASVTKLVPFDMAATSFDDQYYDCVGRMENEVGALRHSEFASPTYAKAWGDAATRWDDTKASVSVPESFRAEYAIAALAYTQKETFLYRDFNAAVQQAGQSEDYYLKSFHFKAFHFFLTRALQVLQTNASFECRETYRGVKGARFVAKPATEARFGYFASSSLNKTEAMNFGEDTFFTIRTCYGANIRDFSFYPEEAEVLIPPFEVFQVENSTETPDGIRITLTSAGILSKYNCVYVRGTGQRHLHADVWMPLLFWGFLLVAGDLGAPGLF